MTPTRTWAAAVRLTKDARLASRWSAYDGPVKISNGDKLSNWITSEQATTRELGDFAPHGTASTDLSVQAAVHPGRHNPE
jgi:hypothetical protein